MLTKDQIILAMWRVAVSSYRADQVVQTLRLYRDRGEYDGSYDSAVECLELACYEIEGREY
jgi:hypothetical protein